MASNNKGKALKKSHILQGAHDHAVRTEEKTKAWNEIHEAISLEFPDGDPKNCSQVKKKWDNLNREARTEIAKDDGTVVSITPTPSMPDKILITEGVSCNGRSTPKTTRSTMSATKKKIFQLSDEIGNKRLKRERFMYLNVLRESRARLGVPVTMEEVQYPAQKSEHRFNFLKPPICGKKGRVDDGHIGQGWVLRFKASNRSGHFCNPPG
ncbi:hypothetical protein OUZ56_026520 [Daphnia magna]|uniref:Regulatory protein zeste n=1 Tax=Daphnia magna TaxID=35525 RepID=A0ABQ9ZLZ8_9CRUS|nr:hypothetical protein OUZ56_026520 [Daphnia magna]